MNVLDNHTTLIHTLKLIAVDPSWSFDQSKGPEESVWRHARAFLSVESVTLRDGAVVENETSYFVSSRAPELLAPRQWLKAGRVHWSVENQNHHTLDTAFAEDTRPWIGADANGMLAVLLLRRIAYTSLALFRPVCLRSDASRAPLEAPAYLGPRRACRRLARAHHESPRPRGLRRHTLTCRAPTGGADIAKREG